LGGLVSLQLVLIDCGLFLESNFREESVELEGRTRD